MIKRLSASWASCPVTKREREKTCAVVCDFSIFHLADPPIIYIYLNEMHVIYDHDPSCMTTCFAIDGQHQKPFHLQGIIQQYI
jgi:hypothetical protein